MAEEILVMGLAVAVLWLDVALGALLPRVIARLAFVPVGVERAMPIPRRATADCATYRDPSSEATMDDSRWRVLEVLPYFARLDGVRRLRSLKWPAVLVVEGRARDGVLLLRARMTVPMILPMTAAFGAMLFLAHQSGIVPAWLPALPLALVLAFNLIVHTQRGRTDRLATAERLVEDVASRLGDGALLESQP